jgi:hypothetical protein
MIRLIGNGRYCLFETRNGKKVLTLEDNPGEKSRYVLINADGIREILITNQKSFRAECILVIGRYRLYEVKDEPDFKTCKHLEFLIGEGYWQGYLLPEGFPTERKTRKRTIPAKELITRTMR